MKIRALLIAMVLLVLYIVPANAHPNASEHYEEIEAVLFNNRHYSSSQQGDTLRAIHMIEYASTLCIDQFGDKNGTLLKGLREIWKVPGMPKSLAEINPNADQTQLSAKNHRTYTHQGWTFNYATNEEKGDLAHSDVRKKILLSTVNKVFSFNRVWPWGTHYTDQCDSFCALLYYIHIIGDYMEDCNEKDGSLERYNCESNGRKIPFASYSEPDVYSELLLYIPRIFPSQNCSPLLSEIQTLAEDARRDANTTDGRITEDRYEVMGRHVKKLMDALAGENGQYNYIHSYLMKEKFFNAIFH